MFSVKLNLISYLLISSFLVAQAAALTPKEEFEEVKKASEKFPDESKFPAEDILSYQYELGNLRSKSKSILSSGVNSGYLGFPVSAGRLVNAQAELSQALVRDWQDIAASGEKYRLATYASTDGKLLESHRGLRLELAHELSTISLLRSSLTEIHKSFSRSTTFVWGESQYKEKVTRSGLLKMTESAPLSQDVLARMSSGLLGDYLELEEELLRLTKEASQASSVREGDRLNKDFDAFKERKRLMSSLLDNFRMFSPESLRQSQVFRDRKPSGYSDIEADASKLGLGFKRTMDAARVFVNSGGLTNHSSGIDVNQEGAEFAVSPELVAKRLRLMAGYSPHGGGGMNFSNLTLPESEKGRILEHFERLLLEHYVQVVAASNGRLKKTPKLISWVKDKLRLGGPADKQLRLGGGSVEQESGLDSPTTTTETQETAADEVHLWRSFAKAAGFSSLDDASTKHLGPCHKRLL